MRAEVEQESKLGALDHKVFNFEVERCRWAITWQRNGGTAQFFDQTLDFGHGAAKALSVCFVTWPERGKLHTSHPRPTTWNIVKLAIKLVLNRSWLRGLRIIDKIKIDHVDTTYDAMAVLPDIPIPADLKKDMFAVFVSEKNKIVRK